jgi:Ni/Fe-hydrogenase subunit HybB-like protein
MFIGYSIAILESVISCYAFKRPFETKELSGMARIIPWLTVIWLSVVVGDLAWRGQLAQHSPDFYSASSCWSSAGGRGSLLCSAAKACRSLAVVSALIVLGGALYRFNVYLIGFNPGKGWHYFPALAELMITVGIVAFEILGYQVLVKILPVLPNLHTRQQLIPGACGGGKGLTLPPPLYQGRPLPCKGREGVLIC